MLLLLPLLPSHHHFEYISVRRLLSFAWNIWNINVFPFRRWCRAENTLFSYFVLFFHSKTRSIITKGVLLEPVTRGILFIVRDLGRTLHNVVSLFALPLNIIFSTQWLWRHGLHSFRWMLHGCVTKIKCLIWNLLISVSDVVGKKLFE